MQLLNLAMRLLMPLLSFLVITHCLFGFVHARSVGGSREGGDSGEGGHSGEDKSGESVGRHHRISSPVLNDAAISTGTISRDGTVHPQQFTISADLLNLINQVRGKSEITPKIRQNNDGTFDIMIKTDQGERNIKGISKNSLNVFVMLFKNPSLNIKTKSQSGNDVTIEVEPNVSGVTSTVEVNAETLDMLKKIKENPNLKVKKIAQQGENYIVDLSDGDTDEQLTVPAKIAKPIIHKLKNPNLEFKVVEPTPDGGAKVEISEFPKQQTKFKVDKMFLDVLNQVRQNPGADINVYDQGNDKLKLVTKINGKQNVYPNLDKNLVQSFMLLAKNPDLPFKVIPGNDGKSTIVLPDNVHVATQTATIPSDFTDELQNILDNPNIKVEVREPSKDNYELVTTEGNQQKVYKLPANAIQAVTQLLKQKIPNFTIVKGTDNDVLSVQPSTPENYEVPSNVPEVLNNIAKHPNSKVKYNIKQIDDDNFDLHVNIDGKPETIKGLNPKVVQILLNQFHHPETKLHIFEEDGKVILTDPGSQPGKTIIPKTPSETTGEAEITPSRTSPAESAAESATTPASETGEVIEPIGPSGVPSRKPTGEFTSPGGAPSRKSTREGTGPGGVSTTRPTGEVTGPTRQVTRPTGEVTGPNSVPTTRPSGEGTGPSGAPTIRPTGEDIGTGGISTTKPTGEVTAPTEEVTRPSGEVTRPSGEVTRPSGEVTRPTGEVKGPTGEVTGPTGEVTGPTGEVRGPTGKVTVPGSTPTTRPTGENTGPDGVSTRRPTGEATVPGGVSTTRPAGGVTGPTRQVTRPTGEVTGPGGVPTTRPSGEGTGPGGVPTKRPTGEATGPSGVSTTRPTGEVTGPGGTPTTIPSKMPGEIPSTLVNKVNIDLLNEVKNAPQLEITVEPTADNNYDITVDDGTEKKKYPHLTIDELILLMKIRNEKNRPFEIKPATKPGQVNVIVPDSNSPDTLQFEVNPEILQEIDQLKHEPSTKVSVQPDDENTYTVNIKSDKIDRTHSKLPSEVVETIARLRTDDDLNIAIKPGHDGKVTLLIPKDQKKPVHTKMTPQLFDVVQNIKQNPDQPIDIKPGTEPDSFTLVVKGKPYQNIPSGLIPILVEQYTNPNSEVEIKPGKDNTVEFIQPSPSPDNQLFKVSSPVLDIISTLRNNPTTKLEVKPQPDKDFTLITIADGKTKKYSNLSPDSLRVIFDLQANPKTPYSVTPIKDGNVIINLPKPSEEESTVPIEPKTKEIVTSIRNNPSTPLDIKPDTDGTYAITLNGKTYNKISPQFLLLMITLISKPTLKFEVVPGYNGQLGIAVPKETPKILQVKIPSDMIDMIHVVASGPNPKGSIQRNIQGGGTDVTIENNGKSSQHSNVSPEILILLCELAANPKLPYHIYPEGKNYVLVLSQRPQELTLSNVLDDVIKYTSEKRTEPNLKIVAQTNNPNSYDIDFVVDGKVEKSFPNSNADTLKLVVSLLSYPNKEVTNELNTNGERSLPIIDTPTTDLAIDRSLVPLLHDAESPKLSNVDVRPADGGLFDITLTINGKPKTYSSVDGKFLYILTLIRTQRNIDINVYISPNGSLTVSLPRLAIKHHFDGISQEFYDFLVKIQPNARDVKFKLSFDGIYFNLDIQSSGGNQHFTKLPGIAIELFVKFLLHPDIPLQSNPGTHGTLEVLLVRQLSNLVFKNVKKKFLSLAKSVKENPSTTLSIKRTDNFFVVLAQGNQGLSLDNASPILIRLFFAIFSDPNFHYKTHLESDGTFTLTIENFDSHPVFNNLDNTLVGILKKMPTATSVVILITHSKSGCGFDVAVAVNGKKPIKFPNIDPDSLKLLVIFLTQKDVKYFERKTSTGIALEVTIETPKNPVINFNLFKTVANVVKDVAKLLGNVLGGLLQGVGNLVNGLVSGIGGLLGFGRKETTTITTQCGVVRNQKTVGATHRGGLVGSIVGLGTGLIGGVARTAGNIVGGVAKAGTDLVGDVASAGTSLLGGVVGGVANAGSDVLGNFLDR